MKTDFDLTNEAIDLASEAIMEFCEANKIEKATALKFRLSMEELLLNWLEHGNADRFSLVTGMSLHRPIITVSLPGSPYNPLEEVDEDANFLSKRMLADLGGGYPTYAYKGGKNTFQYRFPRKSTNSLVKILIAIAAGMLVGLLVKLLPEAVVSELLTGYINPLYSAAFRLLSYIAGPLILLSVTWGIYGIGDATSLGSIGKKLILRFLCIIFLIALCGILTVPLFHLNTVENTEASAAVSTIFGMLLDIIPANVLSPLIDGNTLQIIFTAVLLGIAMLFLGKRVQVVADLVEQINCIVDLLMEFISRLIPGMVFLIFLRIVLNDTLSMLSSLWMLFLAFIAEALILCASFTLITAAKQRVSPMLLLKKSIPSFLIAITTASSTAAFSSNVETCEQRFGIDKSLTAFGLPLGMVMFKTSTTAYYLLISLFFARQFGVSCPVSWVFSAGFVAAMLAIAAPPILGGGVIAYTVLFSRLGIPDDALAIILSVDVLFDFLQTAANMYSLPLELLNCAARLNLLDRQILASDSPKPGSSRHS